MPSSSRLPRKRPSQQRSTLTTEAILQAAVHIFETKGYTLATTVKIAARAGVSVGSLYQYFPNKLAILAGVKRRHVSALFERLEHALRDAEGCEAGLRAAIRINLANAHTSRRLWVIFADELPARLDAMADKPAPAPHVAMLEGFLEKHREALPDRNLAMAAFVIAEMVDAVTRAALQQRPADLVNGVLEAELLGAVLLYLFGRSPASPAAVH